MFSDGRTLRVQKMPTALKLSFPARDTRPYQHHIKKLDSLFGTRTKWSTQTVPSRMTTLSVHQPFYELRTTANHFAGSRAICLVKQARHNNPDLFFSVLSLSICSELMFMIFLAYVRSDPLITDEDAWMLIYGLAAVDGAVLPVLIGGHFAMNLWSCESNYLVIQHLANEKKCVDEADGEIALPDENGDNNV
jgi:hypothetical protein